MADRILTLNGGSSSVKFGVYDVELRPVFKGEIDRAGKDDAKLSIRRGDGRGDGRVEQRPAKGLDLLDVLVAELAGSKLVGVGHRVVHGGLHLTDHSVITDEVLEQLKSAEPVDPVHVPQEVGLIEACREKFPGVPLVVCLDTAFHRELPRMAKLLPIPRRFDAAGVRRFGFHGLSYAYLMGELRKANGADGRVVLAHLGSGASMAAVKDGKQVDTTMGFTSQAGLVMGTRTGDIDPGLVAYLLRSEQMSADDFYKMAGSESGMKGISETTGDIRDLTAKATTDVRAAEAIGLFVYRCRQWLGALTATLTGLDTLVFAGGIGEHAADVRAMICDGFDYLGLKLDAERNRKHEAITSSPYSRVVVRVIPTDEERVIAKTVLDLVRRD